MTELKPYTAWLDECRRTGISPGTPPPPEYQNYDEWYRNTRGINLETGKRDLRSYGGWIAERTERGLPANTPAPEGYESEAEWFKRVRGIDPETGKQLANPKLTDAPSVRPPVTPPPPAGVSGFMRLCFAQLVGGVEADVAEDAISGIRAFLTSGFAILAPAEPEDYFGNRGPHAGGRTAFRLYGVNGTVWPHFQSTRAVKLASRCRPALEIGRTKIAVVSQLTATALPLLSCSNISRTSGFGATHNVRYVSKKAHQ
jgi:hypothetical protein